MSRSFDSTLVDDLAVDRDGAGGDFFQSRQHAQQRRLAAARRPDQHHELAILDVEADAVDDLGAAEALSMSLNDYRCHDLGCPEVD